ncbi:metal-binding protein ZinT [Paenibacillus crassostreae]|uniref:Metal-binding protein n=1 Tax=Paenibacillus crassostreae TaxID=1763538 RepID=A0A167AG30_9BACL|nr:metal-binding protein ZinT [Paenibacillus crassostreae]AOZ92261.1 metal-binding protein ZinT [Paenibacillus crassostreae]OAB70978.1 metal-binding protein [Paenibacillus crassostreae]
MKIASMKWMLLLALGLLLVGCQATEAKEELADGSLTTEVVDSHSQGNNDSDDHDHDHSEEDEKIYKGYFEDNQVEHRSLSDWEGNWQSVYPYLLDGTLDEVFTHKAEATGKMSATEYKEYYEIGYKTDTERIVIQGDTVTFFTDGEEVSGKYEADGFEILTYEAKNKGVRYIFKLVEPTEGLPQYIQFSDHRIAPDVSDHYHLYGGDDREALLEEVVNWPTYYPSTMDGHTIAHEMIAH